MAHLHVYQDGCDALPRQPLRILTSMRPLAARGYGQDAVEGLLVLHLKTESKTAAVKARGTRRQRADRDGLADGHIGERGATRAGLSRMNYLPVIHSILPTMHDNYLGTYS